MITNSKTKAIYYDWKYNKKHKVNSKSIKHFVIPIILSILILGTIGVIANTYITDSGQSFFTSVFNASKGTITPNLTSDDGTIEVGSNLDMQNNSIKNVNSLIDSSMDSLIFEYNPSSLSWYNNSIILDSSPYLSDGTMVGIFYNKSSSFYNRAALEFNGTSYITIPNLDNVVNPSEITVEVWVNLKNIPKQRIINGIYGSTISDRSGSLSIPSDTTGNIRWFIRNTNDDNYYQDTSITNGTHHIIGTFKRNNQSCLYVDSVSKYCVATGDYDSTTSSTSPLIGAINSSFAYPLNGSIYLIRIYNKSINSDEVIRLYEQKTSGGSPFLVRGYSLDDLDTSEFNDEKYVKTLTSNAINSSIESCNQDGCKVNLPCGVYDANSRVFLIDNLWVKGNGDCTVLNVTGSGFSFSASADGNKNVKLSDFRIEVNNLSTASGLHGIIESSNNYSYNWIIENIHVNNSLKRVSALNGTNFQFINNHLENVANGFGISGEEKGIYSTLKFINNRITANVDQATDTEWGEGIEINNHADGRAIIIGNEIIGFGEQGMDVNIGNSIVSNNYIEMDSLEINSSDGMLIGGNSDKGYHIVTGNIITNITKYIDEGIVIDGRAFHATVTDNIFLGSVGSNGTGLRFASLPISGIIENNHFELLNVSIRDETTNNWDIEIGKNSFRNVTQKYLITNGRIYDDINFSYLNKNLTHYFGFEENYQTSNNQTIYDAGFANLHATLGNSTLDDIYQPIFVKSDRGYAIYSDRINRTVQLGYTNNTLDPSETSISVWVDIKDLTSTPQYIISTLFGRTNNDHSGSLELIGSKIRWYIRNSNGDTYYQDTIVNSGKHHIVGTFKQNDESCLFIDGVQKYCLVTGNYASEVGTSPGFIGSRSYANSFNGTIDELRIYNRKLEDGEVRALYEGYGGSSTIHQSHLEQEGIVPKTNIIYSLGSSIKRWLKLWVQEVDASGNINALNYSAEGRSGINQTCINATYTGGIATDCND